MWKHFEHRAVVALPSMRLLRAAQVGHVSLGTFRRLRVSMGSVVPAWAAEALAGVLLVWVAASCYDALSRASGSLVGRILL